MSGFARKAVLPRYVVTETTDEGEAAAARIELLDGTHYFVRPKLASYEAFRNERMLR